MAQPADPAVTIRKMQSSDVPQVVETHLASFPGFFLSFLGPRFLRLLYGNLITDIQGICWVACTGDRLDGFVAGVVEQRGFFRNVLRKRWWQFSWAAVGAALRRPWIVPRLLRALKRPETAGEASAEACLMSIAVHPRARTRGLGRLLVETFSAEAGRRGVKTYCLTTDREGNEQVNQFYRTLGFRLGRTFVTPEGRTMNEYVISLEGQ